MISSFFLSQRKIAQNSGFFTPSQNTWKQSPARITAHTPLLPASSPPPPGSFFLVVVFACDKDQTILVMVKQLWAREERKKSIAVSSFFVVNETSDILPLTFCWWFFCLLLLCSASLLLFLGFCCCRCRRRRRRPLPLDSFLSPFASQRRRFSVMKLYLHILRSCLNIIVLLMSTLCFSFPLTRCFRPLLLLYCYWLKAGSFFPLRSLESIQFMCINKCIKVF